MIKISKKSQYGLRAMVCLAKEPGFCSAREIARKESIPVDFLEKILVKLKEKKLIKVKRGSNGGYALALAPQKISVGDVVRPLENKLVLTICLDRESHFSCPLSANCSTRNVWLKIQETLNQSLDSMSLLDLVKSARRFNKKTG